MTEQKMNLHQKLVEIRKSIDVFKKDSTGYGYRYVSGTQILSKIKDKMDELQVLLVPHVMNQSHTTFNYKDKKGNGKTDFIVTADMKYIWVNAENPDEQIEIRWQTMGQQDDISKAFGSGLTYSERYFLLKFFGVPTDDDDPDARDTTGKKESQNERLATDRQLNYIDSLLKKKVTKDYNLEDLYKILKQKLGTEKEMEEWTFYQAKKAIEILTGKLGE